MGAVCSRALKAHPFTKALKIRHCSRRRPATASRTYSYALTLSYGGEASNTCQAELEVETPNSSSSAAVTMACDITGTLATSMNIALSASSISGITNNVQMTWTLGSNSKTIECSSQTCWNNSMTAPSTAGSYLYDVKYNGTTVCAGSVDIVSPLTCSVSPTTVDKGESYTFRADKLSSVGNCWSCSYTDDAGTTVGNQSVGSDITWDGTALICDGNEHQATAANMPSSGSILTINSGTINKIGCGYGSGTSPCSGTGVTSN